jgi:hypothetical protein
MPKTPAQKKISLAGVRQTLDDHEARYLYECDLADRHNRTANDAGAAGDEERAARFRDYAHKAGERALKLKELVEADRERLHDIVSAPARRKARDATTTGGADPAVHHRAAARLKQRADRSVTKEAKDRAQAGMPPHDPRTAAGKREYHIAGLGRSKRASTLPEGFGDEKTVQARFTAAVDGAARFFNLTPTPFLIDKVLQSVAA